MDRLTSQLKATRSPQLLRLSGTAGFHVVLVYQYVATTREFLAYDPNFPAPDGKPMIIKWSPLGFATVPYESKTSFNKFWATSRESWFGSKSLKQIYSDANARKLSTFTKSAATSLISIENIEADPTTKTRYCVAGLDQAKCYLRIALDLNLITAAAPNPVPISNIFVRNVQIGKILPTILPLDKINFTAFPLTTHDLVSGINDLNIVVSGNTSNMFLDKGYFNFLRAYTNITIQPVQLDFSVTPNANLNEFRLTANFGSMPLTGREIFRWDFSDGKSDDKAVVTHLFPANVPASAKVTLVEDPGSSDTNPTAFHSLLGDASAHYRFSANGGGIDDELLVQLLDPATGAVTTLVHAFFGPPISDVDFVANKGQVLIIVATDYNGGACYANSLLTLQNLDIASAQRQILEPPHSTCTGRAIGPGHYKYIDDKVAIGT